MHLVILYVTHGFVTKFQTVSLLIPDNTDYVALQCQQGPL